MIRKLVLAGVLFIGAIGQAHAKATVKAGEHSDFSRLVVYLPKSQEWTLKRQETGYVLLVPDWDAGFDTSEVFDLIPQTRITAVSTQASILEIALGCECEAVAEPLKRGGVIIDVRAATAPLENPVAEVGDMPEPSARVVSIEVADPEVTLQSELVADALKAQRDTPDPHPDLDVFRRKLLENLGRSASLALVDLAPKSRTPAVAEPKHQSDVKTTAEEVLRFEESGRLRITTAMDAALADRNLLPETQVKKVCPPPANFSIATWGGDQTFGDQLGPARNSLLGEFDEPNTAAVLGLARLYVHFGLGAEAKAVLNQFELPEQERAALFAIANIMEGRSELLDESLKHVGHCEASVAVWSVLGKGSASAIPKENLKDLVAVFASWPVHLRTQFGPALVEAMMKGGSTASADVIASIVKRPNGVPTPELTLVSARSSDKDGYSGAQLREIIDGGSDDAPEALLYFIRGLLKEGQAVDQELVDLAFAFAKELTGLPLGNELSNVGVRALLKNGAYVDALGAFKEAKALAWLPDEQLPDDIVEEFVSSAELDVVVRLAIYLRAESRFPDLTLATVENLIQKLSLDGLPEFANALLQEIPEASFSSNLLADIAAARDELGIAVTYLRKSSDTESKFKRADLMISDGDAEAVWQEMQEELPTDLKERTAWASARWSDVQTSDARGEVASLLTQIPDIVLEQTPLASAQMLQEKSKTSREAITRLLNLNSL